jgi:hypothetical protein
MELKMYEFFEQTHFIQGNTDDYSFFEKVKLVTNFGFNANFSKVELDTYFETLPGFCYTLKEGDTAQVTYNGFPNQKETWGYIDPKIRGLLDNLDGFENFVIHEQVLTHLMFMTRAILQGRSNLFISGKKVVGKKTLAEL